MADAKHVRRADFHDISVIYDIINHDPDME